MNTEPTTTPAMLDAGAPLETSNLKLETSFRDPAELHPHPKVKHLIGRWRPDSDEAVALRRNIMENGILQPLIITERGEILDGVTRWQAAKALALEAVPVTIRPEAEALEILLSTELHRRHSTKGQLAFRLAPMIAEAFAERQHRHLEQLNARQRGTIANAVRDGAKRVDEYAAEMGVSVRLLEQAHELHTLFKLYPPARVWTGDGARKRMLELGMDPDAEHTAAEYLTAAILDPADPMGLGAAKAALDQLKSQAYREETFGAKHGGGRPDPERAATPVEAAGARKKQLDLFKGAFHDLEVRWEYWEQMDPAGRDEAVTAVQVSIAKAPTDALEVLIKQARAELKRREETAN